MNDQYLSAREFVEDAGLVGQASYYSGLPASERHLGAERLELIYLGILKNLGQAPASAFVAMVAGLPSLGPTVFLKVLYALEQNGWIWPLSADPRTSSSICLDARSLVQRDISAALAEWRPDTDVTDIIRRKFLERC